MAIISPNYKTYVGAPAPPAPATTALSIAPSYTGYPSAPSSGTGSTGTTTTGSSTAAAGNSDSGLPGSASYASNVVNSVIEPNYAEYPLPVAPVATPPATIPGPTVMPAPTAGGGALIMAPTLIRSFSANPAFSPTLTASGRKRAGSVLVEQDGAPLRLVVPDGCNAIDVTLGAIEPAPGGTAEDMAPFVDAGKQRISDTAGGELDESALNPGDVVILTIPWRAQANATIDPGVARRAVRIEFYASVGTTS